jgi:hypothetical protein
MDLMEATGILLLGTTISSPLTVIGRGSNEIINMLIRDWFMQRLMSVPLNIQFQKQVRWKQQQLQKRGGGRRAIEQQLTGQEAASTGPELSSPGRVCVEGVS